VKKKYSKKEISIGSIYEVESFACVNVHVKAKRFDNQDLGFFGDIARKEDLDNLKAAGVPWNSSVDWPDDCETFVYFWQVIKKPRKKRNIGKRSASGTVRRAKRDSKK